MLAGVAAIGWSVAASASTMNQNTSWTVNRSDTSTLYLLVAYGAEIYAGYAIRRGELRTGEGHPGYSEALATASPLTFRRAAEESVMADPAVLARR